MTYYSSNALYDEIEKQEIQHLKFVSGNAWQLIYGNANCSPLLLVFIMGKTKHDFGNSLTVKELEATNLFVNLSHKSGLPFLSLQFRIDSKEIKNILFSSDGHCFEEKSLTELQKIYSNFSLPISNTPTGKYLNDKTSSAYHDWQRKTLGRALNVSDVDLWRLNENEEPTVLYELKRSYYSLERWKPFTRYA